MSEILLTWLNTEVDLSKKVTDMEKDFANGYLLGELLYKFNQLTNFHYFIDSNDRNIKIKNFNILQEVFKNIQVSFDSNVARRIMDMKKGEILKLLYEIRSKLEKKGVNLETLSLKKTNHLSELYSSMKFKKEIPPYDEFNRKFFNNRLQQKIKAQKDINMERHLSKFEQEKLTQNIMIQKEKEFEEYRQKLEIEERVKQMKSEGARFRSFQQQYEQDGIDVWKQNMLRMKDIEKKDLDFQLREAEKYRTLVFNSIKASENDAKRKIEMFENNLKNQTLESLVINNNQDVVESKKTFKSAQDFSGVLREKITQKIMNDQTAKKERNRRRRKIIVEQSKAQLEIENRRREDQYIQKLFKQSNQEKQLTYETYRVMQIKNIIIEDRRLRDEMYIERKEMDTKFLEKNEEEFLKYHKENLVIELEKEEFRRKELEIALRQKKRSNNTNMCKKMVELIVDIAEEAFKFQQINDVEDIDPRVWREWTQIFINNESVQNQEIISGLEHQEITTFNNFHGKDKVVNRKDSIENILNSNLMSAYNTKYGQTFYSAYTSEPNYSLLDKIIDDCEFMDYIHFLGQWDKTLIPESAFININLVDLFADIQAQEKNDKIAQGGRKVVASKDKNEDLYKEDDPENLVIPRDTLLNTYLGDLIDILVDMKYEQNENEQKSNSKDRIFSQVPIKLALVGHDFAGKKTQAKILSENYPFKIYIIDQLLKSALDILKRFESPLEDGKLLRTNQLEQIRKERALEEAKYARIKDLAKEIKEILIRGEAVTDEIYVDLLIEFIKIDFPIKSDEDLLNEIFERVKLKEEINEEMERNKENKLKRPRAFQTTEQKLTQDLMKISLEASKGFVIVNFPNTYNQAKILEKKLSAFNMENELAHPQALRLKEEFTLILDKSPKIVPPKKLIQGGLDYIFWLDVPPSECIRRALGRRTLPQTKETQISTNSSNNFSASKLSKYDENIRQIYHLDDNPPPINSDICERLIKVDEPGNSESSLVTRHVAFENSIQSIVEFYEPFGFEKQKIKMFNNIGGHRNKDFVTNDLIEYITRLVEINEQNEIEMVRREENAVSVENISKTVDHNNSNNLNNIIGQNMSIEDKTLALENMHSHMNPFTFSEEDKEEDELTIYFKKIEQIKKALNKDLAEILLKIWSRIFENYVKECKSIFKFLRLQRDTIGVNYNSICQKFIEFLKRPSKKQNLLLDFQLKYNKFMDDYPDLIDDPQVKEEHHQEVDDLNDKIYEIIESRKNEAIEERKKIMNAGWIENEIEKFYLNLERLYQSEIDKFIGSLQILRDYYHNIDNRPLVELPFPSIDIIKEEIDPTNIENENDPNDLPRVEKLYKTALKIQFQYDEALNSAEKKRLEKIQELAKKTKDNKLQVKKNVSADVNEEKKEVFPHEEEMKQAIKNEKAKYRFRVTLLKNWGIFCIKNIRKLANTIYNKLDDWIILSIKAENEALNQLTNILKSNIEKEEKIKYELELDTFDVIINMDVQNYIELPPKPHPAKEVIDHSKFNINQLKFIMEELKTYEVNDEYIRTSTFIDIFTKKYISSKNDNDVFYGIPNLLKKLSFHNYYKFIRRLDPLSSDFLNIRYIGTYFCILNTKVCSNADEESIRKECEKYINIYEDERIRKEDFIKIPMWFDKDEDSPTLHMYENFHRVEKLKEIIFEINKEDNEMMNILELLKIFTLKSIQIDNEKNKLKTYYEVLFF